MSISSPPAVPTSVAAPPERTTPGDPSGPTDGRFLSRDDCAALAKRVARMPVGGGYVETIIESTWIGNVRWARNRISTAGEERANDAVVSRTINGAGGYLAAVGITQLTDAALEAAVRRSERFVQRWPETQVGVGDTEYTEQHLAPVIWSDATYRLDGEARAEVVRGLIARAERAGMVAAGYLEVSGRGRAVMSSRGRAMYYPYTEAQYTVTVRDPQGQGSGWAGLSHYDWTKIDAQAVTDRAIEKCLASRNPVAIEPGRYTTVLEPQAVADLCGTLFAGDQFGGGLSRLSAESPDDGISTPFKKERNLSRLGETLMDERLSVSSDPMDPDLGHVPFTYQLTPGGWSQLPQLEVYRPAKWITNGVLTSLAYWRDFAVQWLGKDTGLPSFGAFRMSASTPPVSMDEMIATTKRGILVTRCNMHNPGGGAAWHVEGYTRDGLWLIENGKVTKPAKNLWFEDGVFFMLQSNRLEQIGTPTRVYHPFAPVFVPALKVRDFNFTQLADAI